ncbi:hypothetical protein Goklo_024238 [Gossypium klotzschianum]|uniref:Uncharacterized protein n=1 Tax=Gossypium klotzschianum TaxID=34286 RepID=A0A7J8W5B0_9ROSI|nr:hypothetical protein [Gossypium klotzschianum]
MVSLLCWAHDLDTPFFIDVIRSSLALSFVFNNISLPTSICEATSRQMWATFPLELLLLVFSSHAELLDVPFDDMTMPLEFSIIPDLPQLPPFLLGEPSCRNTKWSHKMFNEVMRVLQKWLYHIFVCLTMMNLSLLLMIGMRYGLTLKGQNNFFYIIQL